MITYYHYHGYSNLYMSFFLLTKTCKRSKPHVSPANHHSVCGFKTNADQTGDYKGQVSASSSLACLRQWLSRYHSRCMFLVGSSLHRPGIDGHAMCAIPCLQLSAMRSEAHTLRAWTDKPEWQPGTRTALQKSGSISLRSWCFNPRPSSIPWPFLSLEAHSNLPMDIHGCLPNLVNHWGPHMYPFRSNT